MSEEVQIFRGSVEAVVRRDGKFLVVTNRKWGGFSMPGGKLHKGETIEEGLKRELLEETGLVAASLRQIGGMIHKSQPKDGGPDWFCLAYEVDIGDQQPREVEAGTRPFWATADEIVKGGLYPDYYEWLFGVLPPERPGPDTLKRLLSTPARLGMEPTYFNKEQS